MPFLLWHRITVAITTVPSLGDLGLTVTCLLVYGILAIPIGIFSQFLQWSPPEKLPLEIIFKPLFAPALINASLEQFGYALLLFISI